MRYASETATFIVADTGRGIRAGEMERIFKPFQRIEDPAAPVRGTGLGLTITKLLVEMLGGEITLESTPGRGSTFTVRLMLPRAHSLPVVNRRSRRIRGYEGRRRLIFVADDNAEHRGLIDDALRPLGFDLAFAESGEAAMAMLPRLAPDLLLVDVAMPGIDGWELVRRLRKELRIAAPVFMISAHAFDKRMQAGPDRYHDDFLAKPIRIEELLARIGMRLGLEWSHGTAPEAPAAVRHPRPPDEALAALRAASEINHAAGAQAALDALATADPAWAGFVGEARRHLGAFDFAALRRHAGGRETTP